MGRFLDVERLDANNKGDLRIYIHSINKKITNPSSSPEKPRTTHLSFLGPNSTLPLFGFKHVLGTGRSL